ncbi:MAG: DEAD/DEAH box helicase [Acidobacteriota bacterium]
MTFERFFKHLTGGSRPGDSGYEPHAWQSRLAADSVCRDRLIRIPTGFGKTAGVVSAWLWNRVEQRNSGWPRRLILCLPMRTLVEQTHCEVASWLERAGLDPHQHVHMLLGGLSPSDWHLIPECECVRDITECCGSVE